MSEEYQVESIGCSLCRGFVCEGSDGYNERFNPSLLHSNCITCSTSSSEEDTSLCPFCRHLRLPHLFNCLRLKFKQTVRILVSLSKFFKSSAKCCLCRLLVHTTNAYGELAGLEAGCLHSLELSIVLRCDYFGYRFFAIDRRYTATMAIGSHPSESERHGFHTVRTKDITEPNRLPTMDGYVNWKKIQIWIHAIITRSNRELFQRPQRMKVVDVLQNRLTEASADCEYVALSYVYGKNQKITLPSLPYFQQDDLPLTIQDALHACDQMGIQYLWIDQLCINQSDENEKMNQINQMDRIYAYALCTLVALARKDSNYGLPGVTRPRSWTHETVQIGDLTLATRAPSLATCIDCSTWSTRGWTLKEAMLSPRLLYFTEYGIYYEYPDPGVKFESNALCEPVTTYNFPTLDKHWSVVEQYTTRHLTFPSDALCAISAVLRAMHGDEGVYYGLPISQMDQAVVWVPTGNGSNTKRDGFPSWSWVSHDGPIMHPHVLAGLAIWMTPKHGSKSGLSICKPEARIGTSRFGTRNAIDIAAAWLEGCISSQFPVDPGFNSETVYALAARWPTYEAFWEDAFGAFPNDNINLIEHYELAPGHILVYGQVAQFTLDTCKFGKERDMFIVRSRAGIPSGEGWGGWVNPFQG